MLLSLFSFLVAATVLTSSRTTTTNAFQISLDRSAPRQVGTFQEWAAQCGVQAENGFCLEGSLVEDGGNNNEDWYATTSTGAAAGSRVLCVPTEMILSSRRIAQEFDGYIDPLCFPVLEQVIRGGVHHDRQKIYQQFYLFLKVLVEYEQGEDSPYFPWLDAMPRKWSNAVSMDEFCLSCLPPYLLSLCQEERTQYAAFCDALQTFEYVSPETKENDQLLKFAYNVVVTRSFPSSSSSSDDGDDEYDLQIIPMADMLNHGYPGNVELSNDPNSDVCEVYLTQDVAPGTPLTLTYDQPNNLSRLLAKYGFLSNDAPATFCKIMFPNPSPELKDIGYDPERMLYYTADGGISQEVWDVLLYSRLERKPDLKEAREAFYQAHMSGDEETKSAIHQHFFRETSSALLRNVDHVLAEVAELTYKMNAYDSSQHPRLPLLRKHHDMVTATFQKVRANLAPMVAEAKAAAMR